MEELRRSLQSVGGVEDLLVEKLTMISWRQQPLLAGEGAEIRKASEFYKPDGLAKEKLQGANPKV